ncbi:MAG: cyclic nucleotide-binding domain-containing protein [Chthoniobacterales bacterium]|nr:cyclic nucleotide-binding domain-containing protein [Chthoniobacterales bacterium]
MQVFSNTLDQQENSNFGSAPGSNDEVLRHLEANSFCANLPDADLQWLAASVSALNLSSGAILFEDKDSTDSVYLVARGAVSFLSRVSLSAEYTEIARILPGDFFGEGTVIDKICMQHLMPNTTNQEKDSKIFKNRNSRARVYCPTPTLLYTASSKVVSQLLYRQPILMVRNLLKHSADKSRMSSQSLFDEVIKRETKLVVEGLIDWLTRHTIDFLTTLQINTDILVERALGGPSQVFVLDIADTLANYRNTITVLREFAAGVPLQPPLKNINLRDWSKNIEPTLKTLCKSKDITCSIYAEDFEVSTNPTTLDKATHYCFLGILEVATKGSNVEMRVGKNQSMAEIQISFYYPALSEFVLLRLFEPFSLRGENQDVGICLTLSKFLMQSLKGDAQIKRRSNNYLSICFSFPIYSVNNAS